ncbi:Gfo/Idh/MocA family oxidoreductase [Paenibacillus sp. AK121]|uniref:Gfo/Idh/MocA family oxidoreductase n=1 Tax=Paenibacillus TaxID=44249 RepID=UPI001C2437B0|nr:Gfo/Idh/MocA family oxidoreductase [Paenibacillus sp. AK121]MBU9708605.1 Gfo/Idh/MocA family oxidoreductase [Paenibacillus sp. AK121]MEE4569937.1 Gfo/Idh/MocA family oxidoreductase [Paenibacillus polymyxa]
MLTIGYIGNGKSTNRYHLPFSLTRDHLKVKTIYARNPDKGEWEKIPGVQYTDHLESLMNDKEIQLIVVCTPVESHYTYAKMALDHGKNLLIEKPFMLTKEEAVSIFQYAKEKNLIIQCYQNRRYDSDFLTTKKVIESGKLGDLLEVEMHFDYYRPETPNSTYHFSKYNSYLYGHGAHTIDQVLSYFGKPDTIHYDVRQLLGSGRMNDYFDLDFYYPSLKVSIKSSFFRLKERPSFVVYGKKGVFIKQTKDRQEEHLKLYYLPKGHADFGIDQPEHYGILTYLDDDGQYHEEKVVSEKGDYARVYDDLYHSIIHGKEKAITDEETIISMEILEKGIEECN